MIADSEKPTLRGCPTTESHLIPSPHGFLIHSRRLPLGPRRTTIALVLLALGLLVASAGAAFASSGNTWSSGRPATATGGAAPVAGAGNEHGHDHEWADGHDGDHGSGDRDNDGEVDPEPQPEPGTDPDPNTGHDPGHVGNQNENPNGPSAGGDTDGAVGGTSVDTPSAPVQAPAATAGGPAPAAVAPAPIVASALEAFTPVTGPAGGDLGALTVPDAAVVPAVAPMSFEGLPIVGSIGASRPTCPTGRRPHVR